MNDIYPWYNEREAYCGTLSRDLDRPQFIPSNGNSTLDVLNGGNASLATSVQPPAASGAASASVAPSASASAASSAAGPASSVVSAATSGASAAAGSATPTGAAGAVANLGMAELVKGAIGVGGVVLGGVMLL